MAETKVLVVGAGIGGLTAALALQRSGIEVSVVERADDWRKIQVGGGIHLWNNAMRVLRDLGVSEQARQAGSPVLRQEFCSWRGKTLGGWPTDGIERELGVPAVGVARADIQGVLVDALTDGTVRLGAQATAFTQDAEGVTLRLADGSELRADALVGADGINSVIRAQIHGASKPRYAGYAVWQAITDIKDEAAPPGVFRVVWGPGARFAFYHVGGERLYWFAVLNAPEGEVGVDKADLLQHFRGWMEPTERVIGGTTESAINRMGHYDRPPTERWGEGRVTLLGDAAHAMTFNVGQGACQAIEDAVVLANSLKREGDIAAALRAYEASRISRTAAMQKRAWQLGSAGRLTHPVACWTRDRALQVTLRAIGLRTHSKDMAYRY